MENRKISITLDREDAERISNLVGKMHHYAIGTVLGSGAEYIDEDEVTDTEVSAFKLLAAIRNALKSE